LDTRLTTLLCENIIIDAKSKEVKTGCNLAELLRQAMAQKLLFADNDDDDDVH
jgi:hypothetical protein